MFNTEERVAVLSLASILAFRMLGLFIIIPIFSPYLQSLQNSTPLLIGLAMGVYGLTQAIFQLPFGILSDYTGRKEVITLGLCIFLVGCIVAASSQNIWVVILGRAIQGIGAISGTTMALLTDLTSEQSRTKAMAFMGVSVGAAFMLAFIAGPMLNAVLSVNNIFYLIGLLVIPILLILWFITPNNYNSINNQDNKNSNINLKKQISINLRLLSFGVFTLHGILMANFVALPIILKNFNLSGQQQGYIYIQVFIVAIIAMIPMLIYAEKKQQQKKVIQLSVLLLILAEAIFWLLNAKFWGIIFGLVLFFLGFNILEASLPSIVSKLAPKSSKGAVMGLYSTAQFLGPMLGGALAGILFNYFGLVSIFLLGIAWSSLWFILLQKLQNNILGGGDHHGKGY
ncbi:MAG: MFS transporter [Gammaproteobacteria bacterium]|nr:MFS transporter [Gammaproteobacteria bacterium]